MVRKKGIETFKNCNSDVLINGLQNVLQNSYYRVVSKNMLNEILEKWFVKKEIETFKNVLNEILEKWFVKREIETFKNCNNTF